ncbi:MAG: NYN domain-containing protein [Gammaproteobacteria bacterium]|nr:NYN domain-containing protein [Gammaproteobacteria bacterium]
MSDHVAVFIDGHYMLSSGVGALLAESDKKNVPRRFNVVGFKNSIVSIVDRIAPGIRILRIYWYEAEEDDPDSEYQRRVILGKNGIKLRTFHLDSKDDEIEAVTLEHIAEDLDVLSNNNAISDAVIVSSELNIDELVESVQARGVHVHIVEIGRRELERTLDLRASVDTFTPWSPASLRRFLLPNLKHLREDQDRLLDPEIYDLPLDEIDDLEEVLTAEDTPPIYRNEDDANEVDEVTSELDEVGQDEEVLEEIRFSVSRNEESEVVESDTIALYVRGYVENMLDHQIRACVQYWSVGRRDVPTIHDKNVLSTCREGMQRTLSTEERKVMRDEFMRIVNQIFVQRNLEIPATPRIRESLHKRSSGPKQVSYAPPTEVDEVAHTEITEYVEISVAELDDDELGTCLEFWESGQYGVPSIFDKEVMSVCRQELGRNLSESEKHFMRAEFKRIATEIASDRELQ